MTRAFKVGDLVRVITKASDRYGAECTVTSELHETMRREANGDARLVTSHDVDMVGCGPNALGYSYTPDEIELVGYDGDAASSWDDCVFKPKILERIEQ